LFRRVLDLAAEANGLEWRAFADKEFDKTMASELKTRAISVKQKLSELGRVVPPPWRADEKQAAAAAWLVLHGET
jgi:hypothetical protein